jgi:hypothetical protein
MRLEGDREDLDGENYILKNMRAVYIFFPSKVE